jgi:hypothetical protein
VQADDPIHGEARARVEEWLDAVARAEAARWMPVGSARMLPDHLRADSEHWCDRILAAGANPHDAPSVRVALHRATRDTVDLLRHDYEACGLRLSVIEGRNFLFVRVARDSLDLLALPERERADAVARVATALLRAPVRFCGKDPLHEGVFFCSGSRDPLLLASPEGRTEGVIRGGELWLGCYKKPAQRLGFANARQWVSDVGRRRK